MSNIRIFFPESLSLNFNSWLEKTQSHYLTKVMRVKIGENFSLFNKNGEWLAKINSIDDILSFEIIISFMLIGLVPFIIKKIIERLKK